MQQLKIGSTRSTTVWVMDDVGPGGAHHRYEITPSGTADAAPEAMVPISVQFQHGPVGEAGVNGCHHEDLLTIVMHRLQSFQAGADACRENALALRNIEEAMFWLNTRTAERERRGVEGTTAV